MPTTSERLRSLVEGLYLATYDGRLQWNDSESASTFFSAVGGSKVEVTSEPGDDGAEDIRITIYNSDGRAVDTFTDRYFGQAKPTNVSLPNYYAVMNILLEGARRSATGADEIVDAILDELKTPKISQGTIPRPFDDLGDEVPF